MEEGKGEEQVGLLGSCGLLGVGGLLGWILGGSGWWFGLPSRVALFCAHVFVCVQTSSKWSATPSIL